MNRSEKRIFNNITNIVNEDQNLNIRLIQIMYYIMHHPECPSRELEEACHINRQSLHDRLVRLIDSGYIIGNQNDAKECKAKYLYVLTKKGKEILKKINMI